MPSSLTLLLAAAAIGLTVAVPAPSQYTECAAGTQRFVCAKNNFNGCCSVDPCNLDKCPDTQSEIPPATTTSCPSTQTPPPKPNPQPPSAGTCTQEKRIYDYRPSFWSVYRDELKRNEPASSDLFSISQDDDRKNKKNQVITFGVHPNATACSIGWYQPAHAPGFKVEQTGFTQVFQLELGGLPWDQAVSMNGANVSWETVEPLVPEKRLGAADFTFWDTMDSEDHHSVGSVECEQSSLAFLADLDGADQFDGMSGSVSMPQKPQDEQGWYVSYCVEDEE